MESTPTRSVQEDSPPEPLGFQRHSGKRLRIRRAIAAVKERVSCLDVADYHAAGQAAAGAP